MPQQRKKLSITESEPDRQSVTPFLIEQKMVVEKRLNTEDVEISSESTKALKKEEGSSVAKPEINCDDVEMGEFEDPYGDEMESDEEMVNAENEDMQMEDMEEQETKKERDNTIAYLPGQELQEGEVLEFDSSAYKLHHSLTVEWPCLSFDIMRDPYGSNREGYPVTTTLVTGTQGEEQNNNSLIVMKMSKLHKMPKDDMNSDSESEDEDYFDEDPVVEYRKIRHQGAVNRVRGTNAGGKHVVASWADTGNVHIWDVTDVFNSLHVPGTRANTNIRPIFTVDGHKNEGYALDWSTVKAMRLLSGDNDGIVRLAMKDDSGSFVSSPTVFKGHKSSVEDLQWSPTEAEVFASCSSDRTVKIWDTRMKGAPALSCAAHDDDVNVISWNKKVSYLLASGCDDGSFKIWDLRNFKSESPSASFKWHSKAITSIEWNPNDESVLAVSGADDQISLWDFSVELDKEEAGQENAPDVPAQLMFVHMGQQDIKEVHWHPQIPGLCISTALTGFNIFKTISV